MPAQFTLVILEAEPLPCMGWLCFVTGFVTATRLCPTTRVSIAGRPALDEGIGVRSSHATKYSSIEFPANRASLLRIEVCCSGGSGWLKRA